MSEKPGEMLAADYRCHGRTRQGARCAKLGPRVDDEGRRWCGTHGPEQYTRDPVPCAGFGADGERCRSIADAIAAVDENGTEVERQLCRFHIDLNDELGVIRTPAGYGKVRRAARAELELEPDGNGGELLERLDVLDDATMRDWVKQRLAGLGGKTSSAIEGVIADNLKATRWVTFNCSSCGKRNRKDVADGAVRLATAKFVVNDLAEPADPSGGASWTADVDLYSDIDSVPTRVLMSAAYASREEWIQRHHRDGNLGARVEFVLDVERRHAAGKWVNEGELAEAKRALADMQGIAKLLAPVDGISLEKPAAA